MKKAALVVSKVYLGVVGLILISTWARWFVTPEAMFAQYQVSTDTVTGINMLKSDMGGAVLTIGLFVLLFFLRGRAWLRPALVSIAAMLGTRVLSLILDGSTPLILAGVAMETLALLAILFILKNEPRVDPRELSQA